MRTIRKGKEPRSLAEARVAGATYDTLDTRTKVELRAELVSNQGALCCYCMSRIRPDACRIEHYRPQSTSPEEGLAYTNLLAACHGNEGAPPAQQHCDVRKGNRTIRFDPRHPSTHVDGIRYGADGDAKVADVDHQHELDSVLGLNLEHLKRNRRQAIETVVRELSRGAWDLTRVRRTLARCGDESLQELMPYSGAVAWKLRRYLQKQASTP